MTQALQTLSPALDGVMNFFTFLGRIEFYLVLIPFIYWAIDKRIGMRTLLVLIFIDVFGSSFKLLFHQPRPYWISNVKQLAEETSYGIPSTHASNSLAVGGYLAYRTKKNWVWTVIAIIVFFIGLSRIYLAAHFVHDVLFGWFIGALALWAFAKWAEPTLDSIKSKNLSAQMGIGFIASIIIALIGILVRFLISGTTDPASWANFAAEARSIGQFFTLSGALFGSVAGYAMMRQYASFQTSGDWGKRALRYIVGIVGVFVIYIGLDVLFALIAADDTALGYTLRYIRYALVTFWMTFGAPWVFLKLNLANGE